MRKTKWVLLSALSASLAHAAAGRSAALPAEQKGPLVEARLAVEPEKVLRETERHRFLGTNLGLWHELRQLFDSDMQYYLRELDGAFMRVPGGSWSDAYVWNGNGIYDGNEVDTNKYVDGVWQVDYSGYAPGFHLLDFGKPDEWHGNLDVLGLHEFAKDKGARSIVTVNVGSGTAKMAAEWVRWANIEHKFGIEYWEVGNELEGGWELGSTLPAGRILPDGTKLTKPTRMDGRIYAMFFKQYADAMKAVDPSIKVGGPASSDTDAVFLEDLLKYAGDRVDFISFHTYPVQNHLVSEREILDQAFSLHEPMKRFRKLVETYCPDRKEKIEYAVTEWNSKVLEDRDSADLLNGLWTCIFVGEMFGEGVSFATQWDLLTKTDEGGHGMFYPGSRCIPKSQYWGLYMWSKYMGNRLVASKLTGDENAYAMVTRDEDRLFAMVVNVSRTDPVRVTLDVPGARFAKEGKIATLSHREYFWDPYARRPLWSRKPNEEVLPIHSPPVLEVPPFSVRTFELPLEGKLLRGDNAVQNASVHPLEILLPERVAEDVPAEGWVYLQNDPRDPKVKLKAAAAKLSVEGPAKLDVATVSLEEAAARFFLTPTGTGTATVIADAGAFRAERKIEIEPVRERTEIFWKFENDPADWHAESSFGLVPDATVRPNQRVAAVPMKGRSPEPNRDRLVRFSPMPEALPRGRVAGVSLKLGLSSDFRCDDFDRAGIRVVMQSEGAHWIDLGTIPLSKLKRGGVEEATFRLPDPKYRKVMEHLYSLNLLLYGSGKATGRIYVDDLGFVLR